MLSMQFLHHLSLYINALLIRVKYIDRAMSIPDIATFRYKLSLGKFVLARNAAHVALMAQRMPPLTATINGYNKTTATIWNN